MKIKMKRFQTCLKLFISTDILNIVNKFEGFKERKKRKKKTVAVMS